MSAAFEGAERKAAKKLIGREGTVRSRRLWRISLVTAGILEFGMAMAHFGLQYEWTGFDFGPLPRQLAWALLALNFSWTALLLAIGGLVLYAATVGPINGFARKFVFIVGLFWTIHGAYVWLVPMPLPERLAWLQFVLGAFPATLIALHWIPLVACRPALAESAPISSRRASREPDVTTRRAASAPWSDATALPSNPGPSPNH